MFFEGTAGLRVGEGCEKGEEKAEEVGTKNVVLDELNIALKHGYLDLDQVLSDLQARPPMQHVVVTGRGAKPELIEMADTVTEMGMLKHAFQAGIKAQKGIEL